MVPSTTGKTGHQKLKYSEIGHEGTKTSNTERQHEEACQMNFSIFRKTSRTVLLVAWVQSICLLEQWTNLEEILMQSNVETEAWLLMEALRIKTNHPTDFLKLLDQKGSSSKVVTCKDGEKKNLVA